MTTDETRPRRLGELLEEYENQGYKDMTDAEINVIVEYRAECAQRNAEHKARIAAILEHERARTALAEQAYKEAQEAFDNELKKPLVLVTIEEVNAND